MLINLSLIFILLVQVLTTKYKVTTKEFATSYVRLGLQYTGEDEFYVK